MTRRRRYRKYTNRAARATFLEALSKGFPVTSAAKAAHFSRRQLYFDRLADAEFAKEWDEACEEGIDLLEHEALRRATIGRDIPLKDKDGNVVGMQQMLPSDTLLIFLLKARRPDVYRETYRYDLTNSDSSLVAFAKAMQMLEDPEYLKRLPRPPEVIDAEIIPEEAIGEIVR